MKYLYTYEGRTFEVTIEEVTTDDELTDGAKPPRKPRIPLIIVSPAAVEADKTQTNE